jgi:hypothetical protein
VAFPDAVALVITYLDGLHSVPVKSRIPTPRPAELIQVRQVGGAWLPPVRDSIRLDVLTWAATEPAAFTLGETVRRQMHALQGASTLGPVCYRVEEFMAPRQHDDPLVPDNFARWATYSLTLRANDAIHA